MSKADDCASFQILTYFTEHRLINLYIYIYILCIQFLAIIVSLVMYQCLYFIHTFYPIVPEELNEIQNKLPLGLENKNTERLQIIFSIT